jgi:hypothetical protein
MVIASHLLAAAKANVLRTRVCGLSCLFALLPAFLSLLAPATAWGDVYKWTDEQGNPVISNVRPANPKKVRNFEVVAKETERAATRTEQILLDRIDNLERQLRTQQYPPQAQAVPSYYGSYNPAQPPPPPPSYYSSNYPDYYYPWLPSYSTVFFPTRTFVSRPRFGFAHSGFIRGSSVHRGRR